MNPETKPVSFPLDGHPEENQLLLAFERELPIEESLEIEQHLGKCWNCRARSEEMRRGILAFVEYREKRYLPSLKPPPSEFRGFPGQLRSVVGEKPQISLLARVRQWFFKALALGAQLRWASVVAAALVLVLFWTEVLHPPVLSANQLLERAMVAQNPTTSLKAAKPARIARQKVRIRSGQQTVVRDFEWAVGRPIEQSKWERKPDPLQWDAPLTAEGFADWRGLLTEKTDKVQRSADFLKITTITSRTFIREASMVIRANDFHPVAQHFRFSDNRQLDLTEIAFQMFDLPRGRGQAVAPVETGTATSSRPSKAKPRPPMQTLDETELQIRYTLFTHQWDLGEDLLFERRSGRVTVSGIASSRGRGEAMRAALGNMPNVQLLLQYPGTSLSSASPSQLFSKGAEQARQADPLLKSELSAAFASRTEEQEFVDRCLGLSDTALSHTWALKRLVDRYTPDLEQRLGPESKAKLREMLRVHLGEVSRATAGLQPLVDMLPVAQDAMPVVVDDWRRGISSLFAQVQEQDRLIAALVVGASPNGVEPTTAADNFRLDHQKINAIIRESLRDLAANGSSDVRH